MRYRTLTLSLGALVLVSGCSAFWNDEVGHTGTPSFMVADQNMDGYVSRSEAASRASLSAIFDDLDADGDGRISREEYR
ncbi:calmodulin [Salinisphaera sp. PC39]|uniref:calmodulin n=1 Tax=Salinisphaera sp. PC39 TaxID=1304156 RepID=UPI00333FF6A6